MADEIKSARDFEPTPQGLAERWEIELKAADEAVETWHERGRKVIQRYLDEREGGGSRLNLFHSDVETTKALVYDNEPKVHSKRRYADADDDVARVSAEILDRLLNSDIERDDDGFCTALEMARDDRILPGLGCMRFRYVVEMEEVPGAEAQVGENGEELAPAVAATKRKTWEDVETDYVNWEDVRWSSGARNWNEVRYVAFKALMTLDEAEKRFPDVDVHALPGASTAETKDISPENKDAWSRVAVWEIWDKVTRTVYWHVRGHGEILDQKPDPLEIPGFFPCPKPMMANVGPSKLMPVPDFVLAQDLYDEIDVYTERIRKLVSFAQVKAAYDQQCEGLARLLDNATEGKAIPVLNWAAFAQQGGFQGAMAFLPIDQFVKAVEVLVAKRQECIMLLQQITGNSDIMRGGGQVKTATQSRMEGRFGASRTRSRQKELLRFAQDGARIRAAIIAKHFDAETIIKRSNIEAAETIEVPPPPPPPMPPPQPGMPPAPPPPPQLPKKVPNRKLIDEAVALLKSDISAYRIEIADDSLAMTDYDAIQQERTGLIQALGGFFQAMLPMMQDPAQRPYVVRLSQWLVAGQRGAAQAETILDEAARAAEQAAAAPKPPPVDPKLEIAKEKGKAEIGKAQIGLEQTKLDAHAHAQTTAMDMQERQQEHQQKMEEMAMRRTLPPQVMTMPNQAGEP